MTDAAPSPAGPPRAGPIGYLAITASVAAAALLLGGVLFAFASADANGADASDRFRLLAQAANPFIALLALGGSALVVHLRHAGAEHEQRAASAALGIGTAVCLAVVLLALNGVLTDLTGDTTALFRLSAIVSRMATLVLGGVALWIAVATGPARRGSPPPAAR